MKETNSKKGIALLSVIFVVAMLLLLAALAVRIVYNENITVRGLLSREQAFYLAEAGLEKGKVELAHNPNWYTDLPHVPEDDTTWLLNSAIGENRQLGQGTYKVVREKSRQRLYAIGKSGKGTVIIKLVFSPPPLKFSNWEEL